MGIEIIIDNILLNDTFPKYINRIDRSKHLNTLFKISFDNLYSEYSPTHDIHTKSNLKIYMYLLTSA